MHPVKDTLNIHLRDVGPGNDFYEKGRLREGSLLAPAPFAETNPTQTQIPHLVHFMQLFPGDGFVRKDLAFRSSSPSCDQGSSNHPSFRL